MSKSPSKASKAERELAWRERLVRYASSGQSVDAFCHAESVSPASFYEWRSRLRAQAFTGPADQRGETGSSSFIDLGSINTGSSAGVQEHGTAIDPPTRTGIEMRIDLGGGVLLTIVRR